VEPADNRAALWLRVVLIGGLLLLVGWLLRIPWAS
jgi:hypothetical protein